MNVPASLAPHPMPMQQWVYRARCERLIDGDTIIARLDMGLHVERVERIRLSFINAPEMGTPEGRAAQTFALGWMAVAATVAPYPLLIETFKTDDYGRWLGTIWRAIDAACLNDDMLTTGHAVQYPPVVPR
jgi:micrococcal nuclease